jgi:hypothetical protein
VDRDDDLTALLERVEALEEKLCLSLQGLFACKRYSYTTWQNDGKVLSDWLPYLQVNGEAISRGERGKNGFCVVVAVYDREGRVVGTGAEWIYEAHFNGFTVFSVDISLQCNPSEIARLRIYPQAF